MEAITCLPQNWHFLLWGKMDAWDAMVSPLRMYCMYGGMAKGTSRTEATLNNEKSTL